MYGSTVWVAFRSEQVKSAIGNRGTYSAESPSILESPQDEFGGRYGPPPRRPTAE